MIDVELEDVHSPLGSYQGEVAIARVGGLNMRHSLKCGTAAATRVGSVSPDRLNRCANS